MDTEVMQALQGIMQQLQGLQGRMDAIENNAAPSKEEEPPVVPNRHYRTISRSSRSGKVYIDVIDVDGEKIFEMAEAGIPASQRGKILEYIENRKPKFSRFHELKFWSRESKKFMFAAWTNDLQAAEEISRIAQGDDSKPTPKKSSAQPSAAQKTASAIWAEAARIFSSIYEGGGESQTAVVKQMSDRGLRDPRGRRWDHDSRNGWRLSQKAQKMGLLTKIGSRKEEPTAKPTPVVVPSKEAEIKQLEKLHTQLGLDKDLIASDIHNLSSSRIPRQDRAGGPATTTRVESEASFVLDRDLLRLREEETKEAQSVLESIFGDEDNEEEAEIEVPPAAPKDDGAISRLDAQHEQLCAKLISKAEWTREEMEGLCKDLQLMTDGAVETINDWAFDNADAPLIEDGSTVYVDIELAEELAALQTREQMPWPQHERK